MFSLYTKTGRTLIALTVALACLPAAASASPADAVAAGLPHSPVDVAPGQDLRSPDTHDAANRNQSRTSSLAGTTSQDRRSPDARDAALAQERYYSSYATAANAAETRIAARQDLRSPDTRDIADGRKYPPIPTVVTLKEIKAPEPVAATGFDWIAATAGAASTLGLILLMTATAVIITRRRTHREQPVPAS